MTENEAIKIINDKYETFFALSTTNVFDIAMATAIQALEEIQKYRAIGTVKKFKALNEKNIAKKPISSPTSMYGWDCPNCKNIVYDEYDEDDIMPPKHCDTCGQKLDWQ